MSLPRFTAHNSLKRSKTYYRISAQHEHQTGITQQGSCSSSSQAEASSVCSTRGGAIFPGTSISCSGTKGTVTCADNNVYTWDIGSSPLNVQKI